MEREPNQNLSGNEIQYTACSILEISNSSCDELRYQKGSFNFHIRPVQRWVRSWSHSVRARPILQQNGAWGPRLGFKLRVSDFGFRVSSFGFRISDFGFRCSIFDFGFQVSGFGFRVSSFGYQLSGGRKWCERKKVASTFQIEAGDRAALQRLRSENEAMLPENDPAKYSVWHKLAPRTAQIESRRGGVTDQRCK